MIRKFDLVVALYIFGVMVAEIMGAKTFPLFDIGSFHLTASVAIFVLPLLFTLTDVVVEVHGRKRARSMVLCGLVAAGLLMLFAALATSLPPSGRFEGKEAAYDAIFGSSIRLALASLIAFAVSELLDVYIFAKLREKMKNKGLWLRNNVSNFVSQLVDSTVFLTIAFYAPERSFSANVGFLAGLILPYWILRCGLSVLETPLVYLGVKWLRKPEKELPQEAKA